MVPSVPKEEADPSDPSTHTFIVDGGPHVFVIQYTDFNPSGKDPQVILDAARDGAKSKGTLVQETKITLDGNPGRELMLDTKDKYGNPMKMKLRIYLVNTRLYVVSITSDASVSTSSGYEDSMQSFKLLKT